MPKYTMAGLWRWEDLIFSDFIWVYRGWEMLALSSDRGRHLVTKSWRPLALVNYWQIEDRWWAGEQRIYRRMYKTLQLRDCGWAWSVGRRRERTRSISDLIKCYKIEKLRRWEKRGSMMRETFLTVIGWQILIVTWSGAARKLHDLTGRF